MSATNLQTYSEMSSSMLTRTMWLVSLNGCALTSLPVELPLNLFAQGVRHLVAGLAEPKSYQLGQPLSWFGTFETPDKESYARVKNAMNETEGKLLDTIMDLIASVAAYAEVNAMSSSRLCKVLGFWLLAPRRSIPTYQQFYNTWKQSTDTMDRLFLAYLAAQPSLPRRLREILESTNSSHGISVHPALHAVISQPAASSVNGHNNVGSGTDRRRTKSCAALFNKALHSNKTEDTEESEALTEEWWHLLVNEGNSYAQVLNEESARLIALVDPTPETDVKPAVTNSPTSPESPTRRRSMTVDTTSRAFGTPKTLDVAQGELPSEFIL